MKCKFCGKEGVVSNGGFDQFGPDGNFVGVLAVYDCLNCSAHYTQMDTGMIIDPDDPVFDFDQDFDDIPNDDYVEPDEDDEGW